GFLTTDRTGKVIVLEPFAGEQDLAATSDEQGTTIVHSGIKTYRIRLKDDKLAGSTSSRDWAPNAFEDYYALSFSLGESPGDARELAEAQARERAAPRQSPREQLNDSPIPTRRPPARGQTPN